MKLGKKTKIVCTIGPATESEEKIESLIEAGMNVMRLNFSHGNFSEHQQRIDNLKKVLERTGETVATIQDLSGPKIRIGEFENGSIILKDGQTFTLTTDSIIGNEERVSVNYPLFTKEVKVGGYVLLHDGKKKLQITDIKGNDVITKVIIGGELKNKKGVNLPGAYLSMSSITEKDREDLKFAIKNDIDFIALSFVRRPSDISELRDLLKEMNLDAGIIAKIETPEALDNIDEIIKLSNGIMVARGDLAIEIPAEEVPLVQKMLIQKCNALGKPVITATQMLESMIKSSTPTRAEVSDIANAIIDGTDAIMLSEETTLGEYPIQAVEMMTRISLQVEKDVFTTDTIAEYEDSHGITDVTCQSAVLAAHEVEARFLVALTKSGRTARMLARYRPTERIIAMTLTEASARKLTLSFGCYPIVTKKFDTIPEIMSAVKELVKKYHIASEGDKVVIVAGLLFSNVRETNLMLIEAI